MGLPLFLFLARWPVKSYYPGNNNVYNMCPPTLGMLGCLRSTEGRGLRDDTKNGCEGDRKQIGKKTIRKMEEEITSKIDRQKEREKMDKETKEQKLRKSV